MNEVTLDTVIKNDPNTLFKLTTLTDEFICNYDQAAGHFCYSYKSTLGTPKVKILEKYQATKLIVYSQGRYNGYKVKLQFTNLTFRGII